MPSHQERVNRWNYNHIWFFSTIENEVICKLCFITQAKQLTIMKELSELINVISESRVSLVSESKASTDPD